MEDDSPVETFAPLSSAPEPPATDAATDQLDSAVVQSSVPQVVGSVNLLDWEDHSPAPPAAVSAGPSSLPTLKLQTYSAEAMSPSVFQKLWVESSEVYKGSLANLVGAPRDCASLENVLFSRQVLAYTCHYYLPSLFNVNFLVKVFTMASGVLPDQSGLKLFVYALEEGNNGAKLLAQLQVSFASGEASGVVKISTPHLSRAALFLDYLRSSLLSFSIQ